MNFDLNKTQQLFLQMIRSFAENEVKPLAAEVDEEERFRRKNGETRYYGYSVSQGIGRSGRG